MKPLKFLVFFFALGFFQSVLGDLPQNPPVATKLAIYTKSLSETNKIILVGRDNPKFAPFPLSQFAPVGATNPEMGFEPKYLISMNEAGPQLIYAFELGSKGALNLPKQLVNVKKVRRNEFKDYLLPVLLNDPAVLLVRHLVDKNSFRRSKVGSYFLHLIEVSLKEKKENLQPDQQHFSALTDALDGENKIPTNTLSIAAALTVKYHPNGQIGGPLDHKGKLIDDYSAYLNKMFEKVSSQFSRLQVIAAKNNLLVRHLSPFYALVEYNCKTPPSLKFLDGLSLELTATNDLQSYERELCVDEINNIPLVIVALNPAKSFFIPLVNFRDISSEKTKELLQIIKNLSLEAATNIIPFVPSIMLSAGDMLVSLVVNKSGATIGRVDRAALYSQLRMEGDFDLLNLDTFGVEGEVLKIHVNQIRELDASEEAGLNSKDDDLKKEAMNQAVSLMAYDQSGVRFFKSNDRKYFAKKQAESWEAFIKNNEEILQVLP